MTPIFCTLFDSAYLVKGLALIHSLRTHHADGFTLYVLALDEATKRAVSGLNDARVTVIPLAQVLTDKVTAALADRSTAERCWTLSSVLAQHCLETLNLPHVEYCDADMFVLHPLDALYREVARASVAITPHRFSQARAKSHGVNGTYNVGWVYFKNDSVGRACLDEWASLCLAWCYHRNEQIDGRWMFGDQKFWDELVPKYAAHVVNSNGINLAPWNSENYEYQVDAQGRLFVIERCEGGGVKRIDIASLYHAHSLQEKDGRVIKPSDYPIPPMVMQHIYDPYQAVLREVGRRK